MERELSYYVVRATWEAMEALEAVVADLGVVPPRGCLHRVGEMCLLVVWLYGDHCVKVAWTMAFDYLQKVVCRHVNALATRSVPVASTEEVATGHCQTQKVSNIFVQDFWALHGRDAVMDSLWAV